MNETPQLVLDVGGVLGSNLDRFWHELADSAGLPYADMRSRYKQALRDRLWTGEMSEPGFFAWACAMQAGPVKRSEQELRSLMLECLQPLPAYGLLADWSLRYDLHILSNHRAEWLVPFLAPVRPYLKTVTVSSEAGCAKPSAAIYRHVQKGLPEGRPVLFVDDAQHNLDAAAAMGWRTLLADGEGQWTRRLEDPGLWRTGAGQ